VPDVVTLEGDGVNLREAGRRQGRATWSYLQHDTSTSRWDPCADT